MNDYIRERLQNLLIRHLAHNPSKMPLRFYLKEMEKEFISIPSDAIRAAIDVWEEQELYKSKPLNYFKAIVKGKADDIRLKKERDMRTLGGLPRNIV